MAHLRVGCEYAPHRWIPSVRNVALHEGRPQPEVRFTDDSNQRQARHEKQRVPAGQPQRTADFSFPPESWRRFAFRRADGELGCPDLVAFGGELPGTDAGDGIVGERMLHDTPAGKDQSGA